MEDSKKARREATGSESPPCVVAGADDLTATVWRTTDQTSQDGYRFILSRCDEQTGEVSQLYRAEDLFAFVRLVRVLAHEIAVDGCLSDGLRNDLGMLAYTLERFLGSHERRASGTPDVVVTAVSDVLGFLGSDAGGALFGGALPGDLARPLDLLSQWVEESSRESVSPATGHNDFFGVCPVCHSGGERIDVGRVHWLVCHRHELRWLLGEDLIESFPQQTPAEQESARERLSAYQVVEPLRPAYDQLM